jgi:hypothetical protein
MKVIGVARVGAVRLRRWPSSVFEGTSSSGVSLPQATVPD